MGTDVSVEPDAPVFMAQNEHPPVLYLIAGIRGNLLPPLQGRGGRT